MTPTDVLHELLECLSAEDPSLLGWTQVSRWPKGVLQTLEVAGWLTTAQLAQTVECIGCEENCFKSAEVVAAASGSALRAFVNCTLRPDMGRVPVDLSRLRQWQVSRGQVAKSVGTMLGCGVPIRAGGEVGAFDLGTLQGRRRSDVLRLSFVGSAMLSAGGHQLPLAEVLFFADGRLLGNPEPVHSLIDLPLVAKRESKRTIDRSAFVERAPDGESQMAEWRRQQASAAVNARHDKPGGSREKQRRIQEIWATGKYTTRDVCAEQECAALDMSFSAARRALRRTPDPLAATRTG